MAASTIPFKVRALNPATGAIIEDKIEAPDEESARSTLSARGLTVLEVTKPAGGLNMELKMFNKPPKKSDLAVFARMFATMIGAGMPMLRALKVITEQTENKVLQETLVSITQGVESGAKLSESMAEHPTIFPPLMINMVRSGEVGGFLDTALIEIAENTEAEVKLSSDIKSAATYPGVVMAMGIIGGAAMLIFVVPIFAEMFADLGGELPLPTRMMMTLSDVLTWAALPIVGLLIAFGVWWRKNSHRESIRRATDPLFLRLPVFGPLLKKIALGRFSRNLSVMLTSGVQILEALDTVSETAGNMVITDSIRYTSDKIRSGHQMSEFLGHSETGHGQVFPEIMVAMVAVGEESGNTDEMLKKIAQMYEQQVEATTKRLASLLEPILIVVMGVMLGSIVISMYLPMFAVFDLIN